MYKSLILILSIVLISGCGKSGNKSGSENTNSKNESAEVQNNETVEIKLPTIQCGTCKKNITRAFKDAEGIDKVEIDVDGKTAKVSFDKSKTNLGNIENVIVMAGYQANDKPANAEAYEKLDDCCKIGGHDN